MVVPSGKSVEIFKTRRKWNSRAFKCFDTEYAPDSLLMKLLTIGQRGSLKGSKEVEMYSCF
jgi:hypothetical protein